MAVPCVTRKPSTRSVPVKYVPIVDKFDVVICTEVLEHLVDPVKMVANIKGLMNDNGVVLISLPNENSIYHRIMSLSGKGIDMCAFELYKHLHMPTISQSRDDSFTTSPNYPNCEFHRSPSFSEAQPLAALTSPE